MTKIENKYKTERISKAKYFFLEKKLIKLKNLPHKRSGQKRINGVPVVAQRKRIQLGTMKMRVQSLASFRGLRSGVSVSCGAGHRLGSDPAWLWLWCRPVATAPIGPLAWEPPYAVGVALKSKKKKRREREKQKRSW